MVGEYTSALIAGQRVENTGILVYLDRLKVAFLHWG